MANLDAGSRLLLGKFLTFQSGKREHDCAIVIPSANSSELLSEHLDILSRQSAMNFDVIVIGKPPSKAHPKLNILYYQENYPLGSSGGFGLGRMLAYSLGYKYIVNADVDCTPVSKDLMRKLVDAAKKERKAIVPKSIDYIKGGEVRVGGRGTNQYDICPREVFEKSGFEFFRFFRGGEAHEIYIRLSAEGLLRYEENLLVRHKNYLFSYIDVLKTTGNKYVYYKRSGLLADSLLASYFLKRLRIAKCAERFFAAWAEMMKTQLFYSNYPDIYWPVFWAMLGDSEAICIARATRIKTVEKAKGMDPILLCMGGKDNEKGAIAIARGNGLLGQVPVAAKLFQILLARGDYLRPSEKFLIDHVQLLPFLIHIKPIRYSDGKVYSCGMGGLKVAINAVLTLVFAPVFALLVFFGVLRLLLEKYPINPKNSEYNLSKFLSYVQRFKKGYDERVAADDWNN